MDRLKAKYIVDIGLAVSFLAVFVTGIIKFPGLLRKFGLHDTMLPMREISKVHDWTGLLMGIFVFIHLVLNWQWIVAMTKKYLGK